MTEVPYYDHLVHIRGELELQYAGFPLNKCELATKEVVSEIPGLEELAGYFLDSTQREKGYEPQQHAWVYDPKLKLYVDLTLDQFGHYDKISLLPEVAPLLTPCPMLTEQLKFFNPNR